jgi:colicin import membrane protein
MTKRANKSGSQLGACLVFSALLHLAVFAFVLWWQQLYPSMPVANTTYYVDVINLPVAHPQSGSAGQVASPDAAEPQDQAAMQTPSRAALPKANSDSSSFQQRMANLESRAEERRQAAVLESLKARTAAAGRSGMPGGSGKEAGSDYTAYIQSRLKDAFKETISYQTKAPFVVLKLTIDPDGRVVRTRVEKSSGDRQFEIAVQLAVNRAEQRFPPTPDRKVFEGAFVFKPQGVAQK